MEKLIDSRTLSTLLGISISTISRMAKQGILPHVRLSGSIKFRLESIQRWLDSIEVKPESRLMEELPDSVSNLNSA